jgi:hypothetical protein
LINSFRNYLVEEEKTVYFTFGRMNPPTIGHEKLLNMLARKAGRNPYRVFLSQTQDAKKNPLVYNQKVKIARKMFPKHARSIMADKKVKTVFHAMQKLYDEGYKNVIMVVGQDRVREFDILLNKYNGKKGPHGVYSFSRIDVVSAGSRDPDSEGVEGMSASKVRKAAADKDFTAFSQGLPKTVSNMDAKKIYNMIRSGMGLKEQLEFKNHIQLETISEVREDYINGDLFQPGDVVIIRESDEMGVIKHLGSNYVIVESNGKEYRKWLEAVEKVEGTSNPNIWDNIRKRRAAGLPKLKPGDKGYPKTLDLPEKIEVGQDKDIDDLPGSQPASFQKGIKKKSTKAARHRHFQKMTKRDDDDASAYKDAPGDKAARKKGTKPSQYTLRFKKMFGEQETRVDIAKKRIDREKEVDKIKHDRMMDRARMRDALKKNRETQ